MSTKVTCYYDGRVHFYFDYSDFDVHLTVDGREIENLKSFLRWVYDLFSLYEQVKNILLIVKLLEEGEKNG